MASWGDLVGREVLHTLLHLLAFFWIFPTAAKGGPYKNPLIIRVSPPLHSHLNPTAQKDHPLAEPQGSHNLTFIPSCP